MRFLIALHIIAATFNLHAMEDSDFDNASYCESSDEYESTRSSGESSESEDSDDDLRRGVKRKAKSVFLDANKRQKLQREVDQINKELSDAVREALNAHERPKDYIEQFPKSSDYYAVTQPRHILDVEPDAENASLDKIRRGKTVQFAFIYPCLLNSPVAPVKKFVDNGEKKPFPCDECEKSFDFLYYLKRHKVSHSSDRPFGCDRDECTESFKTADHLKRHIDRVHNPDREKFFCDKCPVEKRRPFSSKDNLAAHIRNVHDIGKVWHYCSENKCDRKNNPFSSNSKLQEHIRVVHQGFRYYCRHCNNDFTDKQNCKRHEKKCPLK